MMAADGLEGEDAIHGASGEAMLTLNLGSARGQLGEFWDPVC